MSVLGVPRGAAEVEIAVVTLVDPGSTEYDPEDITLKVIILPGMVLVVNTSINASDPGDTGVPPTILKISPG